MKNNEKSNVLVFYLYNLKIILCEVNKLFYIFVLILSFKLFFVFIDMHCLTFVCIII
ncbi:hypothetical protein HanIR_Chr02g0095871 [Helianthus annuus]|nr:hypothetical protein HanIR_Chr02g0095871 [Helianthus annuus]